VPFGGTLIDPELLCDVSIRQTLTDEVRHLFLSLRKGRSGGLAEQGKAKEATDLADQSIHITDIGEMRSSGEFDQASTFDARGDELALLQRSGTVPLAVKHQRRSGDVFEAIDHVDLVAGEKEFGRRFRRRRLTLIISKDGAGSGRCLRSEDFGQDFRSQTPVAADESYDVLAHLRSGDVLASCPASIEDESIHSLRVSCRPVDRNRHSKRATHKVKCGTTDC